MVCIGDIHGTYKTLQKLLALYPSDQQFCLVGDLVDRGPDSVDVIQFVMDNYDRIKCVKGNHERMMIDFYRGGGRARFSDIWLQNGGKKVWQAYEYKYGSQKRVDHVNFLDSLPYYIEFKDIKDEDGRYLLVSHSVVINANLDACVENQSIIWGRHFPEEDPSGGKWFNVFGHTPTPYLGSDAPIFTEWSANIDTGACYGKYLTGFSFPDYECQMVQSLSKFG